MPETNINIPETREEQEKQNADVLAEIRNATSQLGGQLLMEHDLNLSIESDRKKFLWALSVEAAGMSLNTCMKSMTDRCGETFPPQTADDSPDSVPPSKLRCTFLDDVHTDMRRFYQDFCIELELDVSIEGCKELAGILAFAASILSVNTRMDSLPTWLNNESMQMEKTYTGRLKEEINRLKNVTARKSTAGHAERVNQANSVSEHIQVEVDGIEFEIDV